MMRSVSFVDRVELDFSGNHFSHALAIGDVDSDGLNELVVGNVDGVLAIFKGDTHTRCWRKCSGLGIVTCIGIGDLFNIGKNAVVCVNADGQCHIFIMSDIPASSLANSSNGPPGHRSSISSSNSKSMAPVHTETLHDSNVKVLCIAAIGFDCVCDLFVGQTDRGVAVYRWNDETRSLLLLKKFSFHGQIGSLSSTLSTDGTPQLLVSQPGGTYIPLNYSEGGSTKSTSSTNTSEGPGAITSSTTSTHSIPEVIDRQIFQLVRCGVVGQPQRRSPTSSTEVIGNIIDQSPQSLVDDDNSSQTSCYNNIVALCTLDGAVRMLRGEKKVWELQVDHNLFSIGKLDITGNGRDEIVVCAWDGMTYIIDQSRNIVRFQFEQNVSAFTAGYYGVSSGSNVPCLIYTTFSNKICLYRNITLPAIPASNLILTMNSTMELPEELKQKLSTMSDLEKQKLFRDCLYGCSSQTSTVSQPKNH